ncbi:MAG: cell wall hydrolase [Alphaproteobacteria bacterium]|nr:cell wall hydrolase [Alphaproteobacteria bacterium]
MIPERRGAVREYAPIAFGGAMLIVSFAFAGHYMGKNADAHNAMADESLSAIAAPSTNIVSKGSLLPEGTSYDIINAAAAVKSDPPIATSGKGDNVAAHVQVVTKTDNSSFRIVPAAVNLRDDNLTTGEAKPRLLTPPKAKIEAAFKLKRSEKQQAAATPKRSEKQVENARRRVQLAEENCLARAIYFEARSESELGQLAVAKVILNRVRDKDYPSTICGVVYQGSGSRNSCQFSFACDGLPDDVRNPKSWANSKRLAQKALAGDAKVAAIGSATNYHADYVRPKWAKNMRRLIKIGRHIFYSDT